MSLLIKIILFVFGTAGILWVSWASLRFPRSRGFYRALVFESVLVMFLMAVDSWFVDPFNLGQISSWIMLIISLLLVSAGTYIFYRHGKISRNRTDPMLVGIEKTTELVSAGIYRYIRHPMYSSLLFLTWGIFFKSVSPLAILLTMIVTVLLIIMAKKEEAENLQYFGEKYRDYMTITKMFIPYIY